MSRPTSNDRPIRKIAFTYELGLPATWMIGIKQFKRKLERAALKVRVICEPVETLPKDVDVVFAPAALVHQVRERVPTAEIITVTTLMNEPSYDTLIDRLRLMPLTQDEPSDEPIIVTYRGEERIDSE